MLAGAQPAIPARGNGGGVQPPAGIERDGIAEGIPAGERALGNDWVVRYENHSFHVYAQSRKYAPAQGKVVVSHWQDGTMEIEYLGRNPPLKEISGGP
jgi:hypothetical protein